LPIFVAVIALFDVMLPTSVAASLAFNPLLVFAALQTLFLFGTAVVVAYISLKSYLSGGSRTILLLGSGTLAWGFASMVAGWLLGPPGGPNIGVTISNSGALVSSLFYIGRTVGDPIAWTGRIATYLGGIYSLIAVWSAFSEACTAALPVHSS